MNEHFYRKRLQMRNQKHQHQS